MPWYHLSDPDKTDSPVLLIHPESVIHNIRETIRIAGNNALRPHVKTHKMRAVTDLLLAEGIRQFKCATLKEARMLAETGAPDVLLAYPVVGPKAAGLRALAEAFPQTRFGCLTDSEAGVNNLSAVFVDAPKPLDVWIDLNVGMNRTGINPEVAPALAAHIHQTPGLTLAGLHAYDGHVRDTDFALRCQRADAAFALAKQAQKTIADQLGVMLPIAVGGTPSFPAHARRQDSVMQLSPGTFVFWDAGYRQQVPDLPYEIAAVLLTRVVSIIDDQTLCIDLGHKSVAAENPFPRVVFPDHLDATPIGQSEEHLVVRVSDARAHTPGDVWYGIPIHICPTVNLYDSVQVVENKQITGEWVVTARGH
ncbi:MAG: D-TA family PLP-dependent enzyme [Cytophagales bacterium]|nr:MAG: D-TA family PLP-dependent enzyme [Cytophagales bacterium]